MAASPHALNGIRKAAVVLVLLGEEAATSIYRHLSQPQVQRLTREIAELSRIDPETAASILEEYHRLSLTQDYLTQGGGYYAHNLLVKAFGEDGAKGLLEQVRTRAEISASQAGFAARRPIPSSWPDFSKASIPRPSRSFWRISIPSRLRLC